MCSVADGGQRSGPCGIETVMPSDLRAASAIARRARWVAILTTGVVLAGTASAAEPDPVESAIHRGVELRKRGDDEQALQEFTKAYEASRSPRALAQMGLAEQALGRWVDAEVHLSGALEAKSDAWIQKNRPALESAAGTVAKHLGGLEVLGSPAGAEVLVGGNPAGHLPMDKPLRVPAGDVVIEVRQAGFRPITRTVNVTAGIMSRETIALVPSGTDEQKPPSPPGQGITGIKFTEQQAGKIGRFLPP